MSKNYMKNMELFTETEYVYREVRNPFYITFNKYNRMGLSSRFLAELLNKQAHKENDVSIEIYLAYDAKNDWVAVTTTKQFKAKSVSINLETKYGSIRMFLKKFNIRIEKYEAYEFIGKQDDWYIFQRR